MAIAAPIFLGFFLATIKAFNIPQMTAAPAMTIAGWQVSRITLLEKDDVIYHIHMNRARYCQDFRKVTKTLSLE